MSDELTDSKRFIQNMDMLTCHNPHADDPRFLSKNQFANCAARYTIFSRCCRELSDEHTRCKFQYYRAQIACTQDILDIWDERRQRGACVLDVDPENSTLHMRQ